MLRPVSEATTKDECWLNIYVLLSRLQSMEDFLIVRPPDYEILFGGPPAALEAEFDYLRTLEASTIASS